MRQLVIEGWLPPQGSVLTRKEQKVKSKEYEKTKKGFLVRLYHNMQCRVKGIQTNRSKYYKGLEIIRKEDFYFWAIKSIKFHELFHRWELGNYDRKLVPTVDRIESSKGYTIDNIQWLTLSDNVKKSRKDVKERINVYA